MGSIVKTATPKGKVGFQVKIRRKGLPAIFKTFGTKAEAEAWMIATEAKLLSGQAVMTRKAERFTVAEAISEYRTSHKPSNDEGKKDKEDYRLDFLDTELGALAVSNLTSAVLEKWIKHKKNSFIPPDPRKKKTHYLYDGDRKRTYTDASIRKWYYTLKKVLEWHSKTHSYPLQPVFQQVSPPSTDIVRSRRIEGDEEDRILTACDKMYVKREELKRIIRFALETAARAQEILLAEWHEINLEKRVWNIPKEKCKTKRDRQVPLTTVAVKILQEHKATKDDGDGRVFWQWKNSGTLSQRFRLVCKNAGVKDFRFHDLRHEATSRIFERTDLRDIEIAMITGHTDLRTLKRYANLRSNDLAARMW